MKIQLLSDLHLEAHPGFVPEPAPGAELLVLAGDIAAHPPAAHLPAAHPARQPAAPAGLDRFAGWPVPVLFVPGNHEYDHQDFDAAHARLRQACERLGLVWLERASHVTGGVRFVGTTLWSDFDALAPCAPPATPADRQAAREKAFRAANHYLRNAAATRAGAPFLAEQVRAQALACQAWLRAALAQPFDGRTVVVTHFAPSLRSHDPRYGLTPGTAGFCNALDALLPAADLWLHGHLHCALDWRDASGCRVRANPLGYAAKGEQAAFQPRLVVDV